MEKIEIKVPSTAIIYNIFIVIAGLTLPLILIPITKAIGYSEIIEEVAKALVILFLILKKNLPIIFIETSNATQSKIENFFKKIKYKIYVYEYFIFKDDLKNYGQLGTIHETNTYLIKQSDRFKLNCYNSYHLKKYKNYVTNCIALPYNKNFLKDKRIYSI